MIWYGDIKITGCRISYDTSGWNSMYHVIAISFLLECNIYKQDKHKKKSVWFITRGALEQKIQTCETITTC